MRKKIRIGKVAYLNCLPLYHRLGRDVPEAEIISGTPAVLNSLFLKGELLLNSISSIEYARNFQDLLVFPGLSISSRGSVGSILLFSKVPLTRLDSREVAVTSSSATSSLLLQVILHFYLKIQIKTVPLAPDLAEMLRLYDAALLIGDDALKAARTVEGCHVYDLGELWTYFTALPMVYALFCIHKKDAAAYPVIAQKIHAALVTGKFLAAASMPQIARKGSLTSGLPHKDVSSYLRGLSYDLTPSHVAGYLHFIRLAAELGAAPPVVPMNLLRSGKGGEYCAGKRDVL